MSQRRKNHRVNVDLSVLCSFKNIEHKPLVSTMGQIQDLSTGGMKISVPISNNTLAKEATSIDYEIILPLPFQCINGNGEIRWTFQDLKKSHFQIGLAFSNMDHANKKDIASIVDELVGCITD